MSSRIDKDPTKFFSVVGAPYVLERHVGEVTHYRKDRETWLPETWLPETWLPETGGATLWAVFYAAIIGISLFSHSGAGRLVEVAELALKRTFHL